MDIRLLDAGDAPAAHQWWSAMNAGAATDRVAPLIVREHALITSLRSNAINRENDRRAYGAWSGRTCLGTALIGMPRRENRHTAEIDVVVPPQFRCQGVGAALFDHTLAVAKAAGRKTIGDEIDIPLHQPLAESTAGRFAWSRGFVSRHTELRLLLELPVPKLEKLERLALERSAQYRVVSWQGLPPRQWSVPLARMHTLMDRDVPSGDLDRQPLVYDVDRVNAYTQRLVDQGYTPVTTLAIDPDGDPAAYTTMLARSDENVMQDDTFVLRPHRGHRLGARVKAANLRELARHRPDVRYAHTWTAEVNDTMRAINERFGFRAVEMMHAVELSL